MLLINLLLGDLLLSTVQFASKCNVWFNVLIKLNKFLVGDRNVYMFMHRSLLVGRVLHRSAKFRSMLSWRWEAIWDDKTALTTRLALAFRSIGWINFFLKNLLGGKHRQRKFACSSTTVLGNVDWDFVQLLFFGFRRECGKTARLIGALVA